MVNACNMLGPTLILPLNMSYLGCVGYHNFSDGSSKNFMLALVDLQTAVGMKFLGYTAAAFGNIVPPDPNLVYTFESYGTYLLSIWAMGTPTSKGFSIVPSIKRINHF